MRSVYSFAIECYLAAIRLVSFRNEKAKKWLKGREKLHEELLFWRKNNAGRLLVIHAASLGEFEQGRGIIEEWKRRFPDWKIVVSFFSPSGYEEANDLSGADYKTYLPIDRKSEMKHFLSDLNPDLFVFIRYEFWFNLMDVLHKRSIPFAFVSVHFRDTSWIFKWYGKWAKNHLLKANCVLIQDEASLRIMEKNGFSNAILAGDGRIDRVLQLAQDKDPLPWIKEFKGDRLLFVAGSPWEEDEDRMLSVLKTFPELCYILAPHDISKSNIERLKSRLGELSSHTYSKRGEKTFQSNVLILDTIGMLSRVYAYADFAFIGGGYGDGVHSLLEPAAFGCPLFFGPNHKAFPEGGALIERGAAFEINSYIELEVEMRHLLSSSESRNNCRNICKSFIQSNKGASAKMVSHLSHLLE